MAGVKLSVVNEIVKEGALAILGRGDFSGEGGWRSVRSNGDSDRDYLDVFFYRTYLEIEAWGTGQLATGFIIPHFK
jgi:hypothetical protein